MTNPDPPTVAAGFGGSGSGELAVSIGAAAKPDIHIEAPEPESAEPDKEVEPRGHGGCCGGAVETEAGAPADWPARPRPTEKKS
jgi:hypothetical protein